MSEIITPSTAADFRAIRASLGVTTLWLSKRWGIAERSVQRWESGERAYDSEIAERLVELQQLQQAQVDAEIDRVRQDDEPVMVIPRNDAECAHTPWPAGWLTMVAVRVAWEVPGVKMCYPSEPTGTPEVLPLKTAKLRAYVPKERPAPVDLVEVEASADVTVGHLQVAARSVASGYDPAVSQGAYSSVVMSPEDGHRLIAYLKRSGHDAWVARHFRG